MLYWGSASSGTDSLSPVLSCLSFQLPISVFPAQPYAEVAFGLDQRRESKSGEWRANLERGGGK